MSNDQKISDPLQIANKFCEYLQTLPSVLQINYPILEFRMKRF